MAILQSKSIGALAELVTINDAGQSPEVLQVTITFANGRTRTIEVVPLPGENAASTFDLMR